MTVAERVAAFGSRSTIWRRAAISISPEPTRFPRSRVIAGFASLLVPAIALSACVSARAPQPDPTETVRSHMARVIDVDTGRPVQGAIVLVVFYLWPERGFGNFPASK